MTPITNYQPWIFAFSVFQFLFSTAVAYYVWLSNKQKVSSTRFEAQDRRIGSVETNMMLATNRFVVVETKLVDIDKEVKEIKLHDGQYHQGLDARLNQMNGNINKIEGIIEGRMKGIGSALDMIQQHLLNGGK